MLLRTILACPARWSCTAEKLPDQWSLRRPVCFGPARVFRGEQSGDHGDGFRPKGFDRKGTSTNCVQDCR